MNNQDFIEALESDTTSAEIEAAKATLEGIGERLRFDRSLITKPENLAAILTLKTHALGDFLNVEAAIVKAGIGKKMLAGLLEKAEGEKPQLKKLESPRRFVGDLLAVPELMRGLILPAGYEITPDESGGYVLTTAGEFDPQIIAHCAPFITGRTVDVETGECGIRLSFSRGNGFSHVVINRGDLFNGRKFVDLAGIGYPVTSNNASFQVDYFAESEAANLPQLPKISTTSHLGWQSKTLDSFLIGRELIRGNGESVETQIDLNSMDWPADGICFRSSSAGHEQILKGFRREGSLESWIETVTLAAEFPRVMLGVYAAFASICLPIFDCPSFAVDFCSRTSQGKTTLQRLAASVWGDPNENKNASALLTWNQTKVSIERRLAVLRNLPLLLDDTKKATDPRQIAAIIYSHSGGQGKGRGSLTGVQTVLNWHNVLISSGEQPLTSYSTDGGAVMRVLEIEGAPFGRQDVETGQIVKKINTGACENFGHAGAEFVRYLIQNREHWDAWRAEFKRRAADYLQRAASDKAGRLADYAAALAQAAILAHTALDLPFPYADPLETLWTEISGEADDPLGAKKALRYVLSWAAQNEHRFDGRLDYDKFGSAITPAGGVLGRWDAGEKYESIAFYPHVIEDVLTGQKFHTDSILRQWKEWGWLNCDHPKKFVTKTWIRDEKAQRWMIQVSKAGILAAFDENSESE